MSFMEVLFSPTGRITQGQFWGGWAVIFVASIVGSFIPIISILIWLGLIYVGFCVYGKRLHDSGKSAALHIIPWVLFFILFIGGSIASASGFAQFEGMDSAEIEAAMSENPEVMLGMLGPLMGALGINLLMWLGYTIWVGVSRSDPAANKYGPPPGQVASSDTFM